MEKPDKDQTTHTRRITFDEAVAEMGRRGKIIERLEARIGAMELALQLARGYVAGEMRRAIRERERVLTGAAQSTPAHIDAALDDPPGADGSDIFHHPTETRT